jgi:molybdate transport system substrate-binding protein
MLPGKEVAMPRLTILLLLGVLAASAGCGGADKAPVHVLVAASTREPVQELADAFSREHGVKVALSAGDSSRLAMQIVHDAPADLFLSANEKWADYVREKGYAAETKVLLGNTLVLVVPRGNPASVKAPEDLVGPRVRRVAVAGPTVPAGIYAREALGKLRLWGRLEEQRRVLAGENVRATLVYVERGEAEAGIVYGTDARISERVRKVYEFPAATHAPVRYPLVLLKQGAASDAARRFNDYLRSGRAAKVFAKYGFTWLAGR